MAPMAAALAAAAAVSTAAPPRWDPSIEAYRSMLVAFSGTHAAGVDVPRAREKQRGGSGGALEPPGPLIPFIWRILRAFVPTRLNPLAERACFPQVPTWAKTTRAAREWMMETDPDYPIYHLAALAPGGYGIMCRYSAKRARRQN